MTLRAALKTILVLALALPVTQCVLIWVRGLVLAMGDAECAAVLSYIGTACLATWALSLVGLVIVLAVIAVRENPE